MKLNYILKESLNETTGLDQVFCGVLLQLNDPITSLLHSYGSFVLCKKHLVFQLRFKWNKILHEAHMYLQQSMTKQSLNWCTKTAHEHEPFKYANWKKNDDTCHETPFLRLWPAEDAQLATPSISVNVLSLWWREAQKVQTRFAVKYNTAVNIRSRRPLVRNNGLNMISSSMERETVDLGNCWTSCVCVWVRDGALTH